MIMRDAKDLMIQGPGDLVERSCVPQDGILGHQFDKRL
jgi:hypothetical protein